MTPAVGGGQELRSRGQAGRSRANGTTGGGRRAQGEETGSGAEADNTAAAAPAPDDDRSCCRGCVVRSREKC